MVSQQCYQQTRFLMEAGTDLKTGIDRKIQIDCIHKEYTFSTMTHRMHPLKDSESFHTVHLLSLYNLKESL